MIDVQVGRVTRQTPAPRSNDPDNGTNADKPVDSRPKTRKPAAPEDHVPASPEAPRSARHIAMQALREQDRRLYGG
jgi:hypothetical protein